MKTCPRCGTEFKPSSNGQKYCAPNCDHLPFICEKCGDVCMGYPGKRFCSKECRVSVLTAGNYDPSLQTDRGIRGGAARNKFLEKRANLEGRQTSEVNPFGTRADVYLKRDGRHVHREVAVNVLGRPLEPGEVVHHEDRNKHNNDPHNLIVFISQEHHARHHKLGHVNHTPCECDGIRLKDLV